MTTVEERPTADRVGTLKKAASLAGGRAGVVEASPQPRTHEHVPKAAI
ncbi:hypothetical protein AB0C84_19085 [Actinomadura sp. NPDC048955]